TLVGALDKIRTSGRVWTGSVDIGASFDRRKTTTDLGAIQARHTRRITKHGTGILSGGGAASETGTHAADALLVDGQPVGHQLAGGTGYGYGQGGFEPSVFDHRVLLLTLLEARKLAGKKPYRYGLCPEFPIIHVKKRKRPLNWLETDQSRRIRVAYGVVPQTEGLN